MTGGGPSEENTQASVVERNAGRVILLDPDGRVLLLSCGEPGNAKRWWITPGGGCERGETFADAALREAREELGFDDLQLGRCVWTRTHTFPWLGRTLRQHEHFFVCRTHRREPTTDQQTRDELMYLHGHRWWTADDIQTATEQGEAFAPRRLGQLLSALLTDGEPENPLDVGV